MNQFEISLGGLVARLTGAPMACGLAQEIAN